MADERTKRDQEGPSDEPDASRPTRYGGGNTEPDSGGGYGGGNTEPDSDTDEQSGGSGMGGRSGHGGKAEWDDYAREGSIGEIPPEGEI